MTTYILTFSARKKGAIGVWQTYTRTVQAASVEQAWFALYEEFEHVARISVTKEAVSQP